MDDTTVVVVPWERLRHATAATLIALVIVATGAPPVGALGADDPTSSSTSTSTSTTTTTTSTVTPSTTTTSAATPPTTPVDTTSTTTTTTTVPSPATPAGAGDIPPPPPPPPLPPSATPAELAQAAALQQQISLQSTVLDQLADRYNTAHLTAMAAGARLADAQDKRAKAQLDEAVAKAAIGAAEQTLRQSALDAYLGVELLPNVSHDNLATQAYQLAIAGVYSGSAIETITQRVRDTHSAERRLDQVEQQVESTTQQAKAESAAAVAADQQAQQAAASAAGQQTRLVATLNSVQGDLAALLIVQQATLAQAAYNQLSSAGTLLFTPSSPLPAVLPETTKAMRLALAQIGKPYVWGGTGPDAFDCSGLMQWSWAGAGIGMPRVAADQQTWAIPVPISQVKPGDLVFFGNPAHHVGMYVGDGLMVEAPHTGTVVQLSSIWASDLAGFGRVHR
ncbi:MAG TPA: C40 family peptidase [Acidimicrobiales bacterium]